MGEYEKLLRDDPTTRLSIETASRLAARALGGVVIGFAEPRTLPTSTLVMTFNVDARPAIEALQQVRERTGWMKKFIERQLRTELFRPCQCPRSHPAKGNADWNQHPRRCGFRKAVEPRVRREKRARAKASQVF